MAEVTAKKLTIFGDTGTTGNFGKVGSAQAGSPVNTKDIAVIQALAAWADGLQSAVNLTKKSPYIEELNSILLVLTTNLLHGLEKGIPEWETTRIYYIGDVTKKNGTFELYGSLTNSNTGNALPSQVDNSNWKYLGLLGQVKDIATEVLQEAAADNTVAVTPGTQKFHPTAAKAWAYFDGTTSPATLKASFGISSITNLGGGHYRVNFSTAFSSANYCAVGTAEFQVGVANTMCMIDSTAQTTTQLYLYFIDAPTAGGIAPTRANIIVFGDQ